MAQERRVTDHVEPSIEIKFDGVGIKIKTNEITAQHAMDASTALEQMAIGLLKRKLLKDGELKDGAV